MKKIGKVLIGAAVVGLGIFAVKKVHDKKHKKYHKTRTQRQQDNYVEYDDFDDTDERTEKVEKAVEWVGEHSEQIESVTKVVTLVGAFISIAVDIRKMKQQSKLKKDIDWIKQNLENTYTKGWDAAIHKVAEVAKETVRLDAEAAAKGDGLGKCLTIFDGDQRLDFALKQIPIEDVIQ